MASYLGFQFTKTIEGTDIHILDGYVKTDSSGKVVNQTSAATALLDGYTDMYGEALTLPKGIASITLDGTTAGLYHVKLEQPWVSVKYVGVTVQSPSALAGTMKVVYANPRGSDVGANKAQTIDLQFEQTGSAHSLTSAGFYLVIVLANQKSAV